MTDIHLITGDHFIVDDWMGCIEAGIDCVMATQKVSPERKRAKVYLIPRTAIAYILDP